MEPGPWPRSWHMCHVPVMPMVAGAPQWVRSSQRLQPGDASGSLPGYKADGAAVAHGEAIAQLPPDPFLPVANPLPAPDEHYRTFVPPLGSLSWQSSCHGNQWLHTGQSTGRCSNGQKLANTLCSIKKSLGGCGRNKGFTDTRLGEKTSTSPSWKRVLLKYLYILFSLMAFPPLETDTSSPQARSAAACTASSAALLSSSDVLSFEHLLAQSPRNSVGTPPGDV